MGEMLGLFDSMGFAFVDVAENKLPTEERVFGCHRSRGSGYRLNYGVPHSGSP
jgi:hypothetical protein